MHRKLEDCVRGVLESASGMCWRVCQGCAGKGVQGVLECVRGMVESWKVCRGGCVLEVCQRCFEWGVSEGC